MCIVQNRIQAESIVRQLQDAGFSTNDISVLFPNKDGTHEGFCARTQYQGTGGRHCGRGRWRNRRRGLGLLVGIGALAIPGLGPFIAAGPLLAALRGAAAGATVGGITGALVGMGFRKWKPSAMKARSRAATSYFPFTQIQATSRNGRRRFSRTRTPATSVQRARRACPTQRNHEPNPESGQCENQPSSLEALCISVIARAC